MATSETPLNVEKKKLLESKKQITLHSLMG